MENTVGLAFEDDQNEEAKVPEEIQNTSKT